MHARRLNRNERWTLPMLLVWLLASCAMSPVSTAAELAPLVVYDEALAAGWQDWSWGTTRNFAAATPVHQGAVALAVTHTEGWAGLSLRAPAPLPGTDYTAVAFAIYGGGTPLDLFIQTTDDADPAPGAIYAFTPPAGMWSEMVVPLASLGAPVTIARLTWRNHGDNAAPTYYLDNIRLLPTQAPDPGPLALEVDVAAARQPISPHIYGMNEYGMDANSLALMQELALPIRRWGGNLTTRYNYLNDVSNHAGDWFFANRKQSNAANPPGDSTVNRVIDANRNVGADTLLVVPMSGYVSNDDGEACGFSVTKYGPQQQTGAADGRPDCGNGRAPDGTPLAGNDPLDTSIAVDPTFVSGWVNYLVARYGNAAEGGIRFYNLDNEPDLWHETHRDIRPVGMKYAEFYDRTVAYAKAVKQADPAAAVAGPSVHGWTNYWHSPYDSQRQDWVTPDDRNSHGGVPFIPWYLTQLHDYEQTHGQRLLDILSVHYYPQAPGVSMQGAGNAATQALRLESTRSLWDPTYVDESWIKDAGPEGGIVRLLPRLREWVGTHYPGTKLALGEYNWGALDHLNGALAQADVLGIFGREGLDMAMLWTPPAPNQPGAFAFRIYRNYDGAGGQFGDTRVAAASADQARVSLYAAQRDADNALTLVMINKSTVAESVEVTLHNFAAAGSAQVYRYSGDNLTAILRLADQALAAPATTVELPPSSITLWVIAAAPASPPQLRLHLPLAQR